jgi:predicted transcriptional regulator
MVRLTEKGLLTRRRVGYAFVFTPTVTEDEFIETQRGYVLQALEG